APNHTASPTFIHTIHTPVVRSGAEVSTDGCNSKHHHLHLHYLITWLSSLAPVADCFVPNQYVTDDTHHALRFIW
ncbi:hypothetical protein TYRP_023643, partial [Tyrophagus putrescentiae]